MRRCKSKIREILERDREGEIMKKRNRKLYQRDWEWYWGEGCDRDRETKKNGRKLEKRGGRDGEWGR